MPRNLTLESLEHNEWRTQTLPEAISKHVIPSLSLSLCSCAEYIAARPSCTVSRVSAAFEALRGKIRGAGEAPKTSGSHPNLIKSWWKRMEKDGKGWKIISYYI